MKKEKFKVILKSALFIICYLLAVKGLGLILKSIANSTGVGIRLIYYIIDACLLILFAILVKKSIY